MSLEIGQQIGSYEITSLLGKGGMGEVYRARDSKLKRDVAIKGLPDEFSSDTERVRRFQREAEILASLNHPHIAGIYDFKESQGSRFLVLELVEGKTLAERIARGPIPVDEALDIARRISEALEAAHEKGIIHRDLKPANIKITPNGIVKVLDFGLAKIHEAEASMPNPSQSPTLSMPGTKAGVILGTASYMSPEQAKGGGVDRRTDIFAFGCVLYEMLTGTRAFDGENATDILARVLQREPDWKLLPANVPRRIHELLRLCLQKDIRKRRSDAADVRIDIESALAEPSEFPASTNPSSGRGRLAWLMAAIFLVATLTMALLYFRETPPPPEALPEMRVEINTPTVGLDAFSFALSPDGRQIVFVASGNGQPRLWVRPLDKVTAQPLVGTEGAAFPFWSPDSRSVGFFAAGKLQRIDIAGGLPQTLANAPFNRGGAWSPDGTILFAPIGGGPLLRISASGGEPVVKTKLEAMQQGHQFPEFLPDGRQFLFHARGTPETAGVYAGSLDSGETKRLTRSDTTGRYLSSGWLLWIRADALVGQRLDLEGGQLTGDRVTVADPVMFHGVLGSGAFSVSAAGLIAYRPGLHAGSRTQLRWFDRSGKEQGAFNVLDSGSLGTVSPDGQRVAVERLLNGNTDIWLLDGNRISRFTFDPANDRHPVWSPDGGRVVFDSNRKGLRDLYVKSASGAGGEQPLLESPESENPNDWSADGRFLLYHNIDPQTGNDLWVLPMEGDRKPWPFLKTKFNERNGQFSSDGRWIAYQSNESGRNEIYVRPFVQPAASSTNDQPKTSGGGGQWQVSTGGGIYPRWKPDGTELYYIAPDGQMMVAPITAMETAVVPSRAIPLFKTRISFGGEDTGQSWQYDLTRDGRFLVNTVLDDAVAPITLLQNWNPLPN
jgi:eukaryotic-like serine/threonine-protein kinase